MNNIEVSVIIPVYNVEMYIYRCIKQIINQSYKNIEIIIINDGTKDNSIDEIKEFLLDSRVILINKKNEGLSAARNEGIKIAKGEYILHVDSDDFIDKFMIEKMINKAKKYKLDVVICDVNFYYEKNSKENMVLKDGEIKENEIIYNKKYLKKFFLGEGLPSVWNKMWRKDLYIENEIWHPTNISYGEDGATMPKLILKSKRIGKINESLYYYCQRKNSMMNTNINIMSYLKVYIKIITFLKKNKKLEIYKKYMGIYKYTYVYIHLLRHTYWSSFVQENIQFKILYKLFYKDLKKIELNLIKDKYMILLYFYKKNIYLGESLKFLYLFFKKIKRRNYWRKNY